MTKRISTGMLITVIAMLCACTKPANAPPTSSSSSSSSSVTTSTPPAPAKGILQGTMTIGPMCPVEREGHPCTPTPATFAAHPVTVYSPNKSKIIATMTPDAEGKFSATLPAGTYLVDVEHQAIGAVQGVPATVTVHASQTVTLSISIDTGIR